MASSPQHRTRRRASKLADGAAHDMDHSRRQFLYSLGAAGVGGLLLNRLPVHALAASPVTQALTEGDDERILVIIRLKGGNDGLNTLIPLHDFGTYQRARPALHIARTQAVRVTDELYFHPQLTPLRRLWLEDRMHVVNNVGYDQQNLSHFTSSDIWATASDPSDLNQTGVLGTYLEEQFPDFLTSPPETPPAIQIGGTGSLLFNNTENFNYALSTENPVQLANIVSTGQLYPLADLPDCTYGEQLGYVRAVANTTFRYAGVLADAYELGRNSGEYLNDFLGNQLALVARLIRGGLRTRLYVVELDGFDTHANQLEEHATLLDSLARNTRAFFDDMRAGEAEDRVLAMSISEFGRRVEENGSAGTDHGAAAPMFLFGKGLNGSGFSGGLADMVNTDPQGNLMHTTDFRQVYATVFSRWLCLPDAAVQRMVGGDFAQLSQLGIACQGLTSTTPTPSAVANLKAYRSGADLVVEYELGSSGAPVAIHLFDVGGKLVRTVYRGRGVRGPVTRRLPLNGSAWSSGIYVVSLETGGRMHSQKIGLFR